MRIIPYSSDLKIMWDTHVRASRNGTFLHCRDYMEYHASRFEDASLVVLDNSGRPVALLPASRHGDEIRSHGGLTYGGWIVAPKHPNAHEMLEIWHRACEYYRSIGAHTLLYKPVPYIYHNYPAQEDLYGLFRLGAQRVVTNISSVIPLDHPQGFHRSSRLHLHSAQRSGLTVELSNDYAAYWNMLTTLLDQKYGASPVHTIDEIVLLATRFPDNIKLWVVADGGQLIAGVVVYVTGMVAHTQYIATNERGRRLSAIPLLVDVLTKHYATQCKYLDLGTSNEDSGQVLNDSLLMQKAGFGAMGVAYDHYLVEL